MGNDDIHVTQYSCYHCIMNRPMWEHRLVKEVPVIGHQPLKTLVSSRAEKWPISTTSEDIPFFPIAHDSNVMLFCSLM